MKNLLLFIIMFFIVIFKNTDYSWHEQWLPINNRCDFEFSWTQFYLNWKFPVEITQAFPNNTWSIESVDVDSFVFIYNDNSLYSNILCYYKDKNYVYWLVSDYLLPLFSWFDYESLEVLKWYNNTPTEETCILWGCFKDKHYIYISEWLWWNEPYAWRYDKILK